MDSEIEIDAKSESLLSAEQKHARAFLKFWTLIYGVNLALMVPGLYKDVIRILMEFSPSPPPFGLGMFDPLIGLVVFILVNLTLLLSIYSTWRMWSLYQQRNYGKAY